MTGWTMTGGQGLRILSIDHGPHDLEPMAAAFGVPPHRIPVFKAMAVRAAGHLAACRPGHGLFLDPATANQMDNEIASSGMWLACQYPHSGSAADVADRMAEMSARAVIKVIANARADARTKLEHHRYELTAVAAYCQTSKRDLLVEALPADGQPVAALMEDLDQLGLAPRFWLVEAQATLAAWHATADAASHAGGGELIVIARSAAPDRDFEMARRSKRVIGFVGGRALFGDTFKAWLSGSLDDVGAEHDLVERYRAMCALWDDLGQGNAL